MNFYSQYGQDAFVDKYFNEMNNGIFLDIGAHDGIHLSNSLFFEQFRNWTGICFEPNPRTFKKLLNNRTCSCIEGAIAQKEGLVDFLDLDGLEPLGGILNKYDPRHLDRIERDMVEYNANGKSIIQVKTYNITKILVERGVTNIDYCSIDTEGGEIEILKSIDFSKINIRLFTVEVNYKEENRVRKFFNQITKNSVESFLESKGYKYLTTLGCDVVYCKI